MKKYILSVFILFIAFYGQSRNIDSLKIVLETATKEDSANLLNLIAYYSRYDDVELMKEYCERAYELAVEFEDKLNQGRALSLIQYYYSEKGDVYNAMLYFEKALEVNESIGDTNNIILNLVAMGIAFENIGDLEKALIYYNQTLEITKKANRITASIDAYANISNVQKKMGKFQEAQESLNKCLEILEDFNMLESEKAYIVYNNLGNLHLLSEEFETALSYFKKALKGYDEKQSAVLVSKAKTNIGIVYVNLNEFKLAKKYFTEAEKLNAETNQDFNTIFNLNAFAELHMKEKDFDKALEKSLKAYQLANKNNWNMQTYTAALNVYKCYKEKGLYFQALEYYEKYHELYEKVYKENQQKLISEMEVKYGTELKIEKKQSEIKELGIQKKLDDAEIQKQKNIRNGIILLIFFILIISFLLINRYRLKAAKDQAEKNNLNLTIDHRNRELVSSSAFITEKNRLMMQLKEKLEGVKFDNEYQTKEIKAILREIDRNIDLEQDWEKMKLHFDQVFPDFFDKLNNLNPDLTNLELKHCAYLKMKLSIKEISNILNVAASSVQMAHYRLKKKLELPADQTLSDFITSL
jgi:tetratricopeptide (TPR) repeat protein